MNEFGLGMNALKISRTYPVEKIKKVDLSSVCPTHVRTGFMGPSGVLSSYPHSKKEQFFCYGVSMFDVNSSSNSDNSNREKKHMLVKGL